MIKDLYFKINKNVRIVIIVNLLMLPLFYWLSTSDYLLYHLLVELSTMLVSFLTVIIALLTYRNVKEYYLIRIATGMFFYSILIMFHTLAYQGMNLLPDFGANQATQFWIAANFILVLAVVLSVFKMKNLHGLTINFALLLILTTTLILLIYTGYFPDSYITGVGLTTFKRVSEYIIIFIYLGLITFLIFFNKSDTNKRKSIIAIFGLLAISEFMFTLYVDLFGLYVFLGHYFKYFAFTLIFTAIVMENLNAPLKNLFNSIYSEKETQKKLLYDLEISKSRNTRVQEIGNVGIWELDIKNMTIWASNQAFKIYGLDIPSDNLINLKTIQKMVIKEDRQNLDTALRNLIQNDIVYNVNFTIINGRGVTVHVNSKASIEKDELNNPKTVLGSISDVTELMKKQQQLIFLNNHDSLTKIYNRRYYEENLKTMNIESSHPISLILSDVNGLKLINDTFGHQRGDELLIKTADILKKNIRKTDFVARIGGDEFVILLPNTEKAEAKKILDNIEHHLEKTMIENINISVSFGLDVKESVGQSFESVFKKAEDKMYAYKVTESPSTKNKIISALFSTLYEKDYFSESHSNRVSELSGLLARELNFTEHKINEIISAGLLHDIGKIAISNDILNKKTRLTDEEFKIIKEHPEIGFRILSSVGEMESLAKYILQHHERIDGKGYPNQLTGEEICIEAKIISIADAYDAMTSFRFYKPKLNKRDAIRELQRNMGTQFDEKLTSIFIEKVLGEKTPK